MKSLNNRLRTACEDFRFTVPLDIDVQKSVGINRCPFLRSATDVTAVFKDMAAIGDEVLVSAALDSDLRLLRWNVVAAGAAIQQAGVRIIDAFHGAIMSKASGIVLVQSRSFGRREPSDDDSALTRKIAAAGELLGYPLVDHVIVSGDGYWSVMTRRLPGKVQVVNSLTRHRTRTLAS